MPFSYAQYTGNGSTTTFSVPFPYLLKAHVKLYTGFNILDGTFTSQLVDGVGYTWTSGTQVQTTAAPAAGVVLTVIRDTPDSAQLSPWQDGSNLIADDLNTSDLQNLYVVQEQQDRNDAGASASLAATAAANTATTAANAATATAASATATANTALSQSASAQSTSATALSNSATALSQSTTALSQSAAAVSDSATALSQSNTAIADSATALSQSTTALADSATALSQSNDALSDSATALSQSTTALADSATAIADSATALSQSTTALADSAAAVLDAADAVTTANAADDKADQAIAAVASAILYDVVANVAAIPGSPANNDAVEVTDSTGIESFTPLSGLPGGFVGSGGLAVRIVYSSTSSSWTWIQYFPNDPETRYLKQAGGTVTGNLEIGAAGSLTFEGSTADAFETTLAVADPTADRTITLPNVTGTVVTTGDTGTVTSAIIADGTIVDADISATAAIDPAKINGTAVITTDARLSDTRTPTDGTVSTAKIIDGAVTSGKIADGSIVNADVNASAAIAGTKVAPDFGSQNVTTTGTATAASLNPTGSSVPTNGVYLPAANSVAISTNGSNRLHIASDGKVGIGTTSPGALLHISSSSVDPEIRLTRNPGSGNINTIVSDFYDLTFSSGRNQIFLAGGSERARIDSSGRLLVGTSTGFATSTVQIQGGPGGTTDAPQLALSRGLAPASISSGEFLASLDFTANNGGRFAAISAFADATPGNNDYPGRLTFSTTADGASSPTERMRIRNNGQFKVTSGTQTTRYGNTFNHVIVQDQADFSVAIESTNASPIGVAVDYTTADPNGTTNWFLYCSANGTQRASIRSDGGLANYSANNVNLSDRNVKKDIAAAADTWDCLKEWEIVNFRYKDQPDDADLNMGVIAQQVAESCPEVITVFQEAKEATEDQPAKEERIGVKEQQMMWMAIKALQEAQLRIETLEAKVTALEAQ